MTCRRLNPTCLHNSRPLRNLEQVVCDHQPVLQQWLTPFGEEDASCISLAAQTQPESPNLQAVFKSFSRLGFCPSFATFGVGISHIMQSQVQTCCALGFDQRSCPVLGVAELVPTIEHVRPRMAQVSADQVKRIWDALRYCGLKRQLTWCLAIILSGFFGGLRLSEQASGRLKTSGCLTGSCPIEPSNNRYVEASSLWSLRSGLDLCDCCSPCCITGLACESS